MNKGLVSLLSYHYLIKSLKKKKSEMWQVGFFKFNMNTESRTVDGKSAGGFSKTYSEIPLCFSLHSIESNQCKMSSPVAFPGFLLM